MEQIPAHSGGQVAPDSGGLHQNENGGGAGVSSSILMSDGGIASHIGGCINLAHSATKHIIKFTFTGRGGSLSQGGGCGIKRS